MTSTRNHSIQGAVLAVAVLLATRVAIATDLQSLEMIARGRYLAAAADCAACHTKPEGKPYAGGVALETPFGTLVAPNITPDREAGIGAWTDDEFVAALHEGRGRDGIRLFPAMPYPAYSKMTRSDALAIRAYLQTIQPVPDKIEPNRLPFPLNLRSNMAVWNALNFKPRRLESDPSKSSEWNRGRYLVDALGHCGTCHTPKTWLGADKESAYLEGGTLQGWFAPNITADTRKGIGSWSVDEIVNYLKTGANRDAIAAGDMTEEIVHSSSNLTDDDLKAIAAYLKGVAPVQESTPPALAASDPRMIAGQAIYKDNCAGCHADAGTGTSGLFARLAGSHAVQSDDPTTLIHVVLTGSQGAATADAPTSPAMPSFDWRLDDAQAASVLTYIRNSWGNAAAAVSADQVRVMRSAFAQSTSRANR
jgi:mono/diheme cytochrome c family protein